MGLAALWVNAAARIPAGHDRLHCSQQCMQVEPHDGEGLAVLSGHVTVRAPARCDHLHSSDHKGPHCVYGSLAAFWAVTTARIPAGRDHRHCCISAC